MDTPPARGARPLPLGWHKLRVECLLLLYRRELFVVTECTALQSTAPNFTGLECSYVIPLKIFVDILLEQLFEASNKDPRFGKICREAWLRHSLLKGAFPRNSREAAFLSEPEKYDEKITIGDVTILADVREKQLRIAKRTINAVNLVRELP